MASRDRFTLEPIVETHTRPTRHEVQGELFARLALRPLPVMKEGPEDAWLDTGPTLH